VLLVLDAVSGRSSGDWGDSGERDVGREFGREGVRPTRGALKGCFY
jgi:hypothetical protein